MRAEHRRRPLSLAARITAVVGLVMSAVFAAFTWQVIASIEEHFVEQDLGELQAVVASLRNALEAGPPGAAAAPRLAQAVSGHHGVWFSVQDRTGLLLHGTAPAALVARAAGAPVVPRLDAAALQVWSADAHSYRGAVLAIGDRRVLVATGIDFHLGYLTDLRRALWGGMAGASLIAVVAAWLAVRWGHTPLRRVSAEVRGITSEQLHRRLDPGQVPAELAHLLTSFNAMLDQLQQSFIRLNNFSADIAHELRTPVTNLITQTQVALARPRTADAYAEVLYSALEELERMRKMIADMLFLAQADDHRTQPDPVDVDLAAEVRALFEFFEAWAEESRVGLELHGSTPTVRADRLMLQRALSNLLANGLRYTPSGETLHVGLGVEVGWAVVDISNPGQAIPAAHLPKLFDRFYRVDPSRRPHGAGAGLGLAIVKAIVEAHGGRVEVASDDGATRFRLRLPLRR